MALDEANVSVLLVAQVTVTTSVTWDSLSLTDLNSANLP